MRKLLALTILLTACAPVHDLLHPWPNSRPIASAAPVRLFHPFTPTPDGMPHPGWSPALVDRMRRDGLNPTLTALDAVPEFMGPFRVPTGLERDVLLWKPKP